MQLRAESYLRDVHDNALLIRRSAAGKTLADYEGDVRLRHQIEREFMIIGEALVRFARMEPALAERIADYRGYIGLRNILNHRYPEIHQPTMWDTIEIEIPLLIQEVEQLLDEA